MNIPSTSTRDPDAGSDGSRDPTAVKCLVLVLIGWLTYSVVWSWISVVRIFSFRASVYDLGVFAQSGWRIYHTHLSAGEWLGTALNLGGSIFLSPVVLTGFVGIVVVQSIALGAGGVLVFLIAREYKLRPGVALAISAAYYLYYPLAGVNFEDAHYEAYLIPFFLLGILLCLRGSYKLSILALALSGAIKFPLSIFPLLFGIMVSVPVVARWLQPRHSIEGTFHAGSSGFERPRNRLVRWDFLTNGGVPPAWYGLSLTALCLSLLLGGALTSNLYYPNNGALSLVHAQSLGLSTNLPLKLETLALLLAPLGFVPVLSPRWLPFCAPFFGLVLFVNYYGYVFPYTSTTWYGFMVIPFLFLASVDGLSKISRGESWVHTGVASLVKLRAGSRPHTARPPAYRDRLGRAQRHAGRNARAIYVAADVIVLSTLISAGFLTPYGPWNADTSATFYAGQLFQYNQTLYNEFRDLASLIPPSADSVIIQDNMPTLLPRPLLPGSLSPLVVGPFDQVAYNLTWPDPDGSWPAINPEYVIGSPIQSIYNFFYAQGPYPFNTSMEQVLTELYATYHYGIEGEADGMLLLAHNYVGPLRYYVPFYQFYSPSMFSTFTGVRDSQGCPTACLTNSNLTAGQVGWYGPYVFLSPGTYSVTFRLELSNWSPRDSAILQVTADSGQTLLNATNITDRTVGSSPSTIQVHLDAFVGNGMSAVEFRQIDSHYQGTLALLGVQVAEIHPPSTVFRVGDSREDRSVYQALNLTPFGSSVLSAGSLRPYFDNRTQVSLDANGSAPATPYELYDPTIGSDCSSASASICGALNRSYTSGSYSILGQIDCVTLLGVGSHPLEQYVPCAEAIPVSALSITGAPGQEFSSIDNGTLIVNNQTNGLFAWYGPYTTLPPGNYSVTLNLSVTNNSQANRLTIAITLDNGRYALVVKPVMGSDFSANDTVQRLQLRFDLPFFASGIQITAQQVDWQGQLSLSGLAIDELEPP